MVFLVIILPPSLRFTFWRVFHFFKVKFAVKTVQNHRFCRFASQNRPAVRWCCVTWLWGVDSAFFKRRRKRLVKNPGSTDVFLTSKRRVFKRLFDVKKDVERSLVPGHQAAWRVFLNTLFCVFLKDHAARDRPPPGSKSARGKPQKTIFPSGSF